MSEKTKSIGENLTPELKNVKSNKLVIKKKDTQIANQTTNNILPDIKVIEQFAESVKFSSFANAFKVNGKVNIGDIIANIVLGIEIGITPAASLALGRKLNANSYFSVLRGKELGLDTITSMSKIYILPTANGDIIALDVSIITKAILDKGVEIHRVRDYSPTPIYKSITGQYLGHKYLLYDNSGKLKDDYFLYNKLSNSEDELVEARKNNKIIIIESGITFVTSIRLVRKSHNIDETFHYSIQDATDAGLHVGFHSSLVDNKNQPIYIKGKDNWNNHPQNMLRNRPLSIGGRIVVADALQGSYSLEEANEITNAITIE